jgi:hypothetical protein
MAVSRRDTVADKIEALVSAALIHNKPLCRAFVSDIADCCGGDEEAEQLAAALYSHIADALRQAEAMDEQHDSAFDDSKAEANYVQGDGGPEQPPAGAAEARYNGPAHGFSDDSR